MIFAPKSEDVLIWRTPPLLTADVFYGRPLTQN